MKEKRSLTEDTSAGDEGNIERKGASPRPLPSRKSLCLGVEETRTGLGARDRMGEEEEEEEEGEAEDWKRERGAAAGEGWEIAALRILIPSRCQRSTGTDLLSFYFYIYIM